MTTQTDFTNTEAMTLSRLQRRVLTAFLVGPQDSYTLARSISYSDSWTRRTIRQLREKKMLYVTSVYSIGHHHRCSYALTKKGLTTAMESMK